MTDRTVAAAVCPAGRKDAMFFDQALPALVCGLLLPASGFSSSNTGPSGLRGAPSSGRSAN